jgi:hypothetical protein
MQIGLRTVASLLSSCVLVACSDNSSSSPDVGVALPKALAQSRAIDRDTLQPVVQLSTGQRIEMQRVDDSLWSGTAQVIPGETVEIDIMWISALAAGDLQLAMAQQTLVVDANGDALVFNATDYDYSIDSDGDGRSNFLELEEGTNPFPENETPVDETPVDETPVDETPVDETPVDETPVDEAPVDVFVPRIAQADAPIIDGENVVTDASGRFIGEWQDAVQIDANGVTLGINNLMIDLDADSPSGTPWRSWAVMHDSEFLYVLVMVEDDGQRLGDGPQFWQDDSLEVFLDGDYGRATSYGDDDDYHVIIPLLEPGTTRSPNANNIAGFVAGPTSSGTSLDLQFTTGPGIGPDGIQRPRFEQDIYEFRIELESANIEVGSPFGFELQVNDDDDGGPRDSKWGWAHPSRDEGGVDIDFTVNDPSRMGTLFLD